MRLSACRPKTIRNYENGRSGMGFENMAFLSDYYGIPISALVGRITYEPLGNTVEPTISGQQVNQFDEYHLTAL